MKIVDRYIAKTILYTISMVILLIIGIGFLIGFIGEFRSIGKGDYDLWHAFYYVGLRTPGFLCEVFPLVTLLGCLLGLSSLAQQSELIIMRGAGMSINRITMSILKVAFILVFFISIVGECLAPTLNHQADIYRTQLKSQHQILAIEGGVWLRDGDKFIHIEKIEPGGRLQGVSEFQYDNHRQLIRSFYAEQADYRHHQWLLNKVAQTNIHSEHINTEHHDQQIWPVSLNPDLLDIMKFDPDEMTLWHLNDYIHYLKRNDLNVGGMEVVFWQRLFQPLSIIVMLFLAVPLIFGPLRSSTLGFRLLGGCLLGFGFYILNHLLPPLSAYLQFPAMIGAMFPIALFFLIGLTMQQWPSFRAALLYKS